MRNRPSACASRERRLAVAARLSGGGDRLEQVAVCAGRSSASRRAREPEQLECAEGRRRVQTPWCCTGEPHYAAKRGHHDCPVRSLPSEIGALSKSNGLRLRRWFSQRRDFGIAPRGDRDAGSGGLIGATHRVASALREAGLDPLLHLLGGCRSPNFSSGARAQRQRRLDAERLPSGHRNETEEAAGTFGAAPARAPALNSRSHIFVAGTGWPAMMHDAYLCVRPVRIATSIWREVAKVRDRIKDRNGDLPAGAQHDSLAALRVS